MKEAYTKKDFPVTETRRYLEPGPVVLVSSAHQGEQNIMTLGWHMMLGYDLVGCYIWDANHSHSLIRNSRECVINVPTADMVETVIRIGNSHGYETNKFREFGLTAASAEKIDAPLIVECYAHFECKLIDQSLIDQYSLFVFEVVKGYAAKTPPYPETIHYRGDGMFMVSGPNTDHSRLFKPENL